MMTYTNQAPVLHVSAHAIERYQERVDDVADDIARAALSTAFVAKAAAFGAPYVKLGTGQRIVLVGHHVVTVLPKDQSIGCLDRRRDAIHGRERK